MVGAGPNGLVAAVTLARAGLSVTVVEAAGRPGGGCRTEELTLPGFRHDVCSAVHPLAAASPAMRDLPLAAHGLRWVHPPAPLAHPLDDGTAVTLERGVDATAEGLDAADRAAYRRLMRPLAVDVHRVLAAVGGPVRPPRHPVAVARFARRAVGDAEGLARALFAGERARALVAGLAGHALIPLDRRPSAGFALLLGALGHAVGWPFPEGGAERIADALVAHLRALGGEVATGVRVGGLSELPPARAALLDVAPRDVARIAGGRLPPGYRRRLARHRHGPGVFKLDWALDGPIPWRADACRGAGTVHLGGSLEEIARAEAEVGRGRHPERPFVLLAQHGVADGTRAPTGAHTGWAYCHVPNGSTLDMTDRIERQVERFAPGFRERILARHAMTGADVESRNPTMVGGDFAAGAQDLRGLLARLLRWDPYATPDRGVYICSAATPPGGGVHGLCGLGAARSALRRAFA